MKSIEALERRLIPFLIFVLNNSTYSPVLEWYDVDNMIFRIEWPHKSANHWAEEKTSPQIGWAIFKGKLRAGQKKDFKKLKSNFRCALNSRPELKEVEGLRTKRYRYWKILPNATIPKQNDKPRRRAKTKHSCKNELKKKRQQKNATKQHSKAVQSVIPSSKIQVVEDSSLNSSSCELPSITTLGLPVQNRWTPSNDNIQDILPSPMYEEHEDLLNAAMPTVYSENVTDLSDKTPNYNLFESQELDMLENIISQVLTDDCESPNAANDLVWDISNSNYSNNSETISLTNSSLCQNVSLSGGNIYQLSHSTTHINESYSMISCNEYNDHSNSSSDLSNDYYYYYYNSNSNDNNWDQIYYKNNAADRSV